MSTIVTIQSSDIIANSRADLNTNFGNLNTDKLEKGSGVTGNVPTFGASNVLSDSGKVLPSGAIVGTTDSQALTGKTYNGLSITTTTGTITITNGKTLSVTNDATVSGTNTGDQTISDATITLTDITTNNVSTSKHGFAPKGTAGTTQFWRQDWTLALITTVPAWVDEGSVSWSAESTDKSIAFSNTGKSLYMLMITFSAGSAAVNLQLGADTGADYDYRSFNSTAIVETTGQTSFELEQSGGIGSYVIYFGGIKDSNNRVYLTSNSPFTRGSANQRAMINGIWNAPDNSVLATLKILVNSATKTGNAHLYSLSL